MPQIYKISKLGLKALHKVRHSGGHGVHSPFVFTLITKVIEEKAPYYAYINITSYLEAFPFFKRTTTKYNRLVFKLVNHFNAKNILEIGSGSGITSLYGTSVSKDIEYNCFELSSEKQERAIQIYEGWDRDINLHTEKLPDLKKKQDCIIINLKNYYIDYELFLSYILPLCDENSFIIIKGIRTKRRNQMLWRKLKQFERVTVSMDLFNTGILFFNKKLYKRNYRLNF